MKLKKAHVITLTITIVAAFFIVVKLMGNKKEFKENIEFSQQKVDKIPIAVESVINGYINENVTATGTLEASEVLNLVSETQGKIIQIHKKKGDYVSVGDEVAKVDDDVISANVLTVEANLTQYEKDEERYTRLSQGNAITKRDLEQATIGLKKAKAELISAKKALSNTSIKAPISGYINSENLTVGQYLGVGSPICEIVNNSSLKINIKITEREVYKVKNGQPVSLRLSVFPDKKFTGQITSIAEKADATMKFNVEITLANNANAHLRSGLYAEVELPVKNDEKLIINKSAIIGSMKSPIVYVFSNGKAEKRQLIIGQSNDKQVEVLSGLTAGEQIIVSGQLNLKDGDKVKIVM